MMRTNSSSSSSSSSVPYSTFPYIFRHFSSLSYVLSFRFPSFLLLPFPLFHPIPVFLPILSAHLSFSIPFHSFFCSITASLIHPFLFPFQSLPLLTHSFLPFPFHSTPSLPFLFHHYQSNPSISLPLPVPSPSYSFSPIPFHPFHSQFHASALIPFTLNKTARQKMSQEFEAPFSLLSPWVDKGRERDRENTSKCRITHRKKTHWLTCTLLHLEFEASP